MGTWPVSGSSGSYPNYPGGSTNPYSGTKKSTPKVSGPSPYSISFAQMSASLSSPHRGYPFNVTPQEEFDERPLLVGSLTGIRCFRVDDLGRLNAVNEFPNSVWTPGENIATCHRQWQIDSYIAMYYSIAVEQVKVPEHQKATLGCSCGYYAYYDNGDNPHHQQGFLYGVVEGYGVMTVGTRGFRCSKAQIKALVIPAKQRSTTWMKVARNYNSIPQFETDGDAFKRFPLSLPEDIPNPDNTPDFWTKDV